MTSLRAPRAGPRGARRLAGAALARSVLLVRDDRCEGRSDRRRSHDRIHGLRASMLPWPWTSLPYSFTSYFGRARPPSLPYPLLPHGGFNPYTT
eukprot:1467396-Prymnesium_polylepis.1